MKSLILSAVAKFITPFMLAISVFLLLRGHNEPGGGFAGGLVGAAALALHMFTFSEQEMRRILPIDPRTLAGIGLLASIISGIPAIIQGKPFLTAVWTHVDTPLGTAKLGTPLLFDIGVFLIVIGVTVSFLEDMHEEE